MQQNEFQNVEMEKAQISKISWKIMWIWIPRTDPNSEAEGGLSPLNLTYAWNGSCMQLRKNFTHEKAARHKNQHELEYLQFEQEKVASKDT